MELKTITLSPDMRKRLETAMEKIKKRYQVAFQNSTETTPEMAQLILDATSAAIWGTNSETYKEFGLTPLTDKQRKESSDLADALIGMANGSDSPAFVLKNLPKDKQLYEMALAGFGLSIDSHDYKNIDDYSKRIAHGKNPSFTIQDDSIEGFHLESRAKQPLHSDTAGSGETPRLRIIGGFITGENPLPTLIASVNDLIDETTINIIARRSEYAEVIPVEWDYNKIHDVVTGVMIAPLWKETEHVHRFQYDKEEDRHKEKIPVKSKSLIYHNNSKHENAPEFGLFCDPNIITQYTPPPDESELMKLGISHEIFTVIRDNVTRSLQTLKHKAEGVVVEPSTALLWNDSLVFHSAGHFQHPDVTSTKRETKSFFSTAGLATNPNDPFTPGAHPLASSFPRSR